MQIYALILLSGIVKTFSPYMRKHILTTLESHEYFLLNLIIFLIIISIVTFCEYVYIQTHNHVNKKQHSIVKLYRNCCKLTTTQKICAMTISLVTICTSIVMFELDKKLFTPLINSTIIKVISTFLLVLVSIFIFEEKYKYSQMFGLFLTVVGAVLLVVE